MDGETRVYLVKDKFENIVLFFLVKCGLLVGENLEEKLSEEYQESDKKRSRWKFRQVIWRNVNETVH